MKLFKNGKMLKVSKNKSTPKTLANAMPNLYLLFLDVLTDDVTVIWLFKTTLLWTKKSTHNLYGSISQTAKNLNQFPVE